MLCFWLTFQFFKTCLVCCGYHVAVTCQCNYENINYKEVLAQTAHIRATKISTGTGYQSSSRLFIFWLFVLFFFFFFCFFFFFFISYTFYFIINDLCEIFPEISSNATSFNILLSINPHYPKGNYKSIVTIWYVRITNCPTKEEKRKVNLGYVSFLYVF